MPACPTKTRITATLCMLPRIALLGGALYSTLSLRWRWDRFDVALASISAVLLLPCLWRDARALGYNLTEYRSERACYDYRRDRARRRGDRPWF